MPKKRVKPFTNKLTAIVLACGVLAGSMTVSITSMVQKSKISKAYDKLLQDNAEQNEKYQLILKEKESLEAESSASKKDAEKLKEQLDAKDAEIAKLVEENGLASAEAKKYKKHFELLYDIYKSMSGGTENAELKELKKIIEQKNEEIIAITKKYNLALIEIESLKGQINNAGSSGDSSIEVQLAQALVKIKDLEGKLGQVTTDYELLVIEYGKVCKENTKLKEQIEAGFNSDSEEIRNDLIELVINKYSLTAEEVNQMSNKELLKLVYGLVGEKVPESGYAPSDDIFVKEDDTEMERGK